MSSLRCSLPVLADEMLSVRLSWLLQRQVQTERSMATRSGLWSRQARQEVFGLRCVENGPAAVRELFRGVVLRMANVRRNIGQATNQIATRHPQKFYSLSRFSIRLASSLPTTFCITGATYQQWIYWICPWTKVPVTPAHFLRSSVALGGLGMLLCPSLHSPRATVNGLPSFWMTSPFVRWPGRYCCCTCCLKVREELNRKWL